MRSQFPVHKSKIGISKIKAVDMQQTPTPSPEHTALYHGSDFDRIQEKINDSLKAKARTLPGERLIRKDDGHWYRYEAGKPVRLTEDEVRKELPRKCW